MDNSLIPMRISVAMATYNGEKYIEEQLLSICRQTRKPDEIVISDDGSRDATLEVATRVSKSEEARGIDFVIITDNSRHGCGGNFGWALEHTSGDIVFICGQDDRWTDNKVEQVERVFLQHEDALCVLHNAKIINSAGEITEMPFMAEMDAAILTEQCPEGYTYKLDSSVLEQVVSRPIVSGITIAIKRELVRQLQPFPVYAEDQWIEFLAVLNDGCYFTNQILAYYRKHNSNTSGSRSKGLKKVMRLLRVITTKENRIHSYMYLHELGKGFIERMEEKGLQNSHAYETAKRVYEIGIKKLDAYEKGGVIGGWKLIALFRKDIRYRRIGFWAFFGEFMFVLKKNW